MTKFQSLVSLCGFDKMAAGIARGFSSSRSTGNLQKVFASLKAQGIAYSGPRNFRASLSPIATRAFRQPQLATARFAGRAPFID